MGCNCGGSTHPRQAREARAATRGSDSRTPVPATSIVGGRGYYWTGPEKAAEPEPEPDQVVSAPTGE